MKRVWKKILATLITSLFIAQNLTTIIAAEVTYNEYNIKTVDQEEALEAYNKIIRSFKIENNGDIIYPEEYGGEYIDGDILVILLVNRNPSSERYYLSLCDNSKKVIFKDAKYSLNYLYGINDFIETVIEDFEILSFGVDHKENDYNIKISNSSYYSFNNYISICRAYEFPLDITTGEYIYGYANINGGTSLDEDTVTCGGTYNGQDAILLCGHTRRKVGDTVYDYSGNAIATVRRTSYTGNLVSDGTFWNTSMLGDYAIATLNSGYYSTRYIHTSSTSFAPISSITSAPVGTNVYRYSKVTGSAFGSVTATNQNIQFSPNAYGIKFYISGLSEVDMSIAAQPGDSGGPFYTHYSTYNIIGTLSGGNDVKNSNNRYTTYFSPISFATTNNFTPKFN